MKFKQSTIEFFGNIVCSCFVDIFTQNKMPQIIFQMSIDDTGLKGVPPGMKEPTQEKRRIKQQVRFVMLDNSQTVLTKEEINGKIRALQTKQTDVGFSYTSEGLRIIVVPENMTHLMPSTPGVPFGTPQG